MYNIGSDAGFSDSLADCFVVLRCEIGGVIDDAKRVILRTGVYIYGAYGICRRIVALVLSVTLHILTVKNLYRVVNGSLALSRAPDLGQICDLRHTLLHFIEVLLHFIEFCYTS